MSPLETTEAKNKRVVRITMPSTIKQIGLNQLEMEVPTFTGNGPLLTDAALRCLDLSDAEFDMFSDKVADMILREWVKIRMVVE